MVSSGDRHMCELAGLHCSPPCEVCSRAPPRSVNVSGEWKSLVDSVNQMAGRLTDQVRSIAKATTAVARGDLSQKVTIEANGEVLQLVKTINSMVDRVSDGTAWKNELRTDSTHHSSRRLLARSRG